MSQTVEDTEGALRVRSGCNRERSLPICGRSEWRERRWQRHGLRKRRREDKRCVGPQRDSADRRGEAVVHLLRETVVPEEVWRE